MGIDFKDLNGVGVGQYNSLLLEIQVKGKRGGEGLDFYAERGLHVNSMYSNHKYTRVAIGTDEYGKFGFGKERG